VKLRTMDTLKDFWKDIKDRISTPFFSSFVISWIIFNYPIVIALLFYKQSELKVDGYSSYLNMIKSCYDSRYMIKYPLIAAALYSVFFKEILRIIQTNLITWSETFILWSTKKSWVSAEVHRASEKTLRLIIADYAESVQVEGSSKIDLDKLKQSNAVLIATHDFEIKELNRKHDERYNNLMTSSEKRVIEAQQSAMKNAQDLTMKFNRADLKSAEQEGALARARLDALETEKALMVTSHQNARLNQEKSELEKDLSKQVKSLDDLNRKIKILQSEIKKNTK